jgi:putative oxidoreductase
VIGLGLSGLALVMLFFGQRVAKDYPGAAVLASYFGVALIGLWLHSATP